MKHSITPTNINLPPAYDECTPLVVKFFEADYFKREAVTATAKLSTEQAIALSGKRLNSLKEASNALYSVMKVQASDGRYEIFEAEGIKDFIFSTWDSFTFTDEELVELFLKFVQNDPSSFKRFLVKFQDLTTPQTELIWSAFEDLLNSTRPIEGQALTLLSKAETTRLVGFNSLLAQGLISASKWERASLSVLTKAYSLVPEVQLELLGIRSLNLDPIHISSDGLSIEGPPKDFATRHPYAFKEKFCPLGADPKIFEAMIDYLTGKPITLPSWVAST